jgi:hypothetical protein
VTARERSVLSHFLTTKPEPHKPLGKNPQAKRRKRLTRDVVRGECLPMKASDVENIEDTLPPPTVAVAGKRADTKCPYCGEPWRRIDPSEPFRWQTHFTTGWWPAYPDAS